MANTQDLQNILCLLYLFELQRFPCSKHILKASGFHIITVKLPSPTYISLANKKTRCFVKQLISTYQAQMCVSNVWNIFLFDVLGFTLHSTPKHCTFYIVPTLLFTNLKWLHFHSGFSYRKLQKKKKKIDSPQTLPSNKRGKNKQEQYFSKY